MSELKLVDLTEKSKKRKNASKKESPAKKVVTEYELVEEVVKDIEDALETPPVVSPEENIAESTVDKAITLEKVKKPPTEKQLAAREAMKAKREAKKAELAEIAKAEALVAAKEAEIAIKKAEEKKLKAAEKRRAKKEAEVAEILKPSIKPKKPVGKSIAEPIQNIEPKIIAVEPPRESKIEIFAPPDYSKKHVIWGRHTPFQGNKIF